MIVCVKKIEGRESRNQERRSSREKEGKGEFTESCVEWEGVFFAFPFPAD
jgi:hypothetical protein